MSIASRLAAAIRTHTYRQRRPFHARSARSISMGHQALINFASNDYLGLATDPRVNKALSDSAHEFGFGSGSSAMISGYGSPHQELEEAFAAFLGRERAIFFNSGYHANLGVITTFADRHTAVVADKHCHASIIDAITLSRARHYRFRHQDIQHAEQLLKQQVKQRALLITESVFSMSGDVLLADQITALANQHQLQLIIDDAHGFGVIGNNGRGITEHCNLTSKDVSILVTPLGKALGGVGAIVSGDHTTMEYLLQQARTYRYSTALPPAICHANLRALQIISEEPWRTTHLQSLSVFFNHAAKQRNLPMLNENITPIKCLLTNTNEQTISLQEKLISRGFYAGAIRPPTVPENSSRLRISLNIHHTESDINHFLDVLAELNDHQST